MWQEIFNLAIKNGLWAVLFMGLFIFVIKDSAKREQKYQITIQNLTNHLGIVKDIKEEVEEIKNYVNQTKKPRKKSSATQVEEKETLNEKQV